MSDFEQNIAYIREAAAGIKRTLDEATVMSTQKAEQTERILLVKLADFFDALAVSAQQLLAKDVKSTVEVFVLYHRSPN